MTGELRTPMQMTIKRLYNGALVAFAISIIAAQSMMGAPADGRAETKYLVIRADDIGMSHSVNVALKELLDTGYPVSASVMFPCPWYREAVSILKEYDNVSVGIHLTLNSEWENYRWGPIVGREAVPSLVDADGHFHHKTDPLKANPPKREEMEKELRAQIERAMTSGLKIDYVDYHMGIRGVPGFNEVCEKLANEYGLGMWGDYGMARLAEHYAASPDEKTKALTGMIDRLSPGYSYVMTHIGMDDSELGAMRDMNSSGSLSNDMSKHRYAELTALTSLEFARSLLDNGVTLVTFRDVMDAKSPGAR